VEADLASDRRYEALSSLAYAYYVTSRRAAASPDADPEMAARLARWTTLLGDTYQANREDPRFQAALREAAGDLERRAPAVTLECTDADGHARACTSTAELVARMNDARDHAGLRGRVARLLERWLGTGTP
jgi:hypothetical protein